MSNAHGNCIYQQPDFEYLLFSHTSIIMMTSTLLGVDHALAPPTGRQARLAEARGSPQGFDMHADSV